MVQLRGKWTGKLFTYHDSRQIFVPGQGWKVEFLIDPSPNRFWVWAPAEDFEPVPEQVADILEAAVSAGKEVLDRLVAVLESDPITGVDSLGRIERKKCRHAFMEQDYKLICNEDARWVVGCMRADNTVYCCTKHHHITILKKAKEQPGETLYTYVIDPQSYDKQY